MECMSTFMTAGGSRRRFLTHTATSGLGEERSLPRQTRVGFGRPAPGVDLGGRRDHCWQPYDSAGNTPFAYANNRLPREGGSRPPPPPKGKRLWECERESKMFAVQTSPPIGAGKFLQNTENWVNSCKFPITWENIGHSA